MILAEGKRLRLRRATQADVDFILDLQHRPENRPHIVPYERDKQETALTDGGDTMNVVVEEKDSGTAVGYVFISGLAGENDEVEWTHVVIDKKGLGYGHETMQLLKFWSFDKKNFHRAWIDCKIKNPRALHLYESEGMIREGVLRESILYNGEYQDLAVLGMLKREYETRKAQGREIDITLHSFA